MEREEEIKQAAENYAASVCKDCAARFYCKERIRKCDEYREQVTVYADAAMWADEHPKNVWHDVKEGPNKPYPIIIEIDDDIDPTYEVTTVDGKDDEFWKFITSEMDITRWAYINDLLPKNK